MTLVIACYAFWGQDHYENGFYGIVCSFLFAAFISFLVLFCVMAISGSIKMMVSPEEEHTEIIETSQNYLEFINLEFGAIAIGFVAFCIVIGPLFYLGKYIVLSIQRRFERSPQNIDAGSLCVRTVPNIVTDSNAVIPQKVISDKKSTSESENTEVVETAEVFAVRARHRRPREGFITRIFGLKIRSAGITTKKEKANEINRLRPYFVAFRNDQNMIIKELFRLSTTLGFEQNFAKIGVPEAMRVHDKFSLGKLPFAYPSSFVHIKERFERAASYPPYFAMRNYLIRKHNLSEILSLLIKLATTNPNEIGQYLKSGEVSTQTQDDIQNQLAVNVYGEHQNFYGAYARNHLAQLRNIILDSASIDMLVKFSLLTARLNPIQIRQLVGKVMNGFTQVKHKQTVQVSRGVLSDFIQKTYFATIKRRTSKLFQINLHKSTRAKKKLAGKKSPTPRTPTELGKFVNSIVAVDIRDFLQQRNRKLDGVKILNVPNQDLINLTENIVKKVLDEYSNSKDPLKSLIFPSFARIPIQSIDQTGFETYLSKKIEYKVKELLIESLPGLNADFQQSILNRLKFMQTNLNSLLKCPEFSKNTIPNPFFNELWTPHPIYDLISPLQLQEMQFIFSPEVHSERPVIHGKMPDFVFGLPASNFKRITDLGIGNIETAFTTTAPTLRLDSRKFLLHQPFVKNEAGDPNLNSNTEMGIDLGLKDFAVISIRDSRTGKEIARYFLDQKSVFGMKFNDASGKFTHLPPITIKDKMGNMIQKPVDYNIARKLSNIHSEIGDVQSELDQCPVKYPNDKKRLYHLEKRLECEWEKQNRLHLEIVHQVSHKILQIAKFNKVGVIKFEDLRWSQQGKKRDVGWWLSSNQRHWLHGKIIDHVTQMAKREGIEPNLVDARWSSQICPMATQTIPMARDIKKGTTKASIGPYLGTRSGKTFTCDGKCHVGKRHSLDADLAAARNISMRPVKMVL